MAHLRRRFAAIFLQSALAASAWTLSNSRRIDTRLPAVIELADATGSSFCSGTIVGVRPTTVVTAAHCLANLEDGGLYLLSNGAATELDAAKLPASTRVFYQAKFFDDPLRLRALRGRQLLQREVAQMQKQNKEYSTLLADLRNEVQRRFPQGAPADWAKRIAVDPALGPRYADALQRELELHALAARIESLEREQAKSASEIPDGKSEDWPARYDLAVLTFSPTYLDGDPIPSLLRENKVMPVVRAQAEDIQLLVSFGESAFGDPAKDPNTGFRQASVYQQNSKIRHQVEIAAGAPLFSIAATIALISTPDDGPPPPGWPQGFMSAALNGDSGGAILNRRGLFAVIASQLFSDLSLVIGVQLGTQRHWQWPRAPVSAVLGPLLESDESQQILGDATAHGASVIRDEQVAHDGPELIAADLFDVTIK